MRVLMLSDVYFPRVNGVSTSVQTFAHELLAQGHDVSLIAPSYGEDRPDGFPILRVTGRAVPRDPEDRIMSLGAVKALLPRIRATRADVLHIQTPFAAHYGGLWLARRAGLPVVESYHTYFEESLDKYLPALPRAPLRWLARRFSTAQCNSVDAVVVPTVPMRRVLEGYGVRTPIEVIPTGLPATVFTPGDGPRFRERFAIPTRAPLLLYVGRVAHEKNIGFLLEVLAALPRQDVMMVIAGEGPARSSLAARALRMGLGYRVRFVGYLSRHAALADCYRAGDVLVFASRTETQGLVLLEAMAQGLPVVTTAVMGTAAVMRDLRGGLVAEEEVGDFAAKVQLLLADEALRRCHGAEALRKAREWSAATSAGALLRLYRRVRITTGR